MNGNDYGLLGGVSRSRKHLYVVSDVFWQQLESIEGVAGQGGVPRRKPERARFLCQIEWFAVQYQFANYYISLDLTGRRWVLWSAIYIDQGTHWDWYERERVQLIARKGYSQKQIAMVLLHDYLLWQVGHDEMDMFWGLKCGGILRPDEIKEIAHWVWDSDAAKNKN